MFQRLCRMNQNYYIFSRVSPSLVICGSPSDLPRWMTFFDGPLKVLMGIGRAVYESTNKAIFADFFPGEKSAGAAEHFVRGISTVRSAGIDVWQYITQKFETFVWKNGGLKEWIGFLKRETRGWCHLFFWSRDGALFGFVFVPVPFQVFSTGRIHHRDVRYENTYKACHSQVENSPFKRLFLFPSRWRNSALA